MPTTHLGSRLGRGAAASLVLSLCACDPAPADVSLRISTYGEDFVEDRIPADVFVDGWEVTFDRLLVIITDVEADGAALPGAFVVDLTLPSSGEGHELGTVRVPAEDHPELSFAIRPVRDAEAISASADDRATMLDSGWSILAEGEATRDGERLRFSWGFATATTYQPCHGTADLAQEAEPRSQLTIHADHLFYDDLDSETPNVAFDLIASADADGDGEVTPAELRAVEITAEARYQVGSRDIDDLWGFIEVQTTTLGHIDGEGHCQTAG